MLILVLFAALWPIGGQGGLAFIFLRNCTDWL